jgi:hypothetical protein
MPSAPGRPRQAARARCNRGLPGWCSMPEGGYSQGVAERRTTPSGTASRGVLFVRYGIPAVLLLAGIVCLLVAPSGSRAEAWALFTGAGLAVLLLNVLYRMGVSGDRERQQEEDARTYFAEHGEWPDEAKAGKRKWHLPANIATPESEEEEQRRGRDG